MHTHAPTLLLHIFGSPRCAMILLLLLAKFQASYNVIFKLHGIEVKQVVE
uniref:Uncharacterized protein n=1 Tax=Rhizophora mucronata TaxID=61149 RepID=A0A2P2PP97_RHIMU